MRKPAYMNLYNRANMHISVGILDQSFAKMSKRKAVSSSSKTGSDRVFELVSLGRESYASKSAIAKLLAHIEKMGCQKHMIEALSTERGRKSAESLQESTGQWW